MIILLLLILIILFLELTQILVSKIKILKWFLPVLFFILSILVASNLFIIEYINFINYPCFISNTFIPSIFVIFLYFAIVNIPTVIFIITNIILKKKDISRLHYIIISIFIFVLIILIILVCLYIQNSISSLINPIN